MRLLNERLRSSLEILGDLNGNRRKITRKEVKTWEKNVHGVYTIR
jgi:hypothetical protein